MAAARDGDRTIASPQVRNAATVAGNLVQAKRCWFFRNGFDCYKRNGASSPCYAVLGDHRFQHAAVDGHRCQAVTPSDLRHAHPLRRNGWKLDAAAGLVEQAVERILAP